MIRNKAFVTTLKTRWRSAGVVVILVAFLLFVYFHKSHNRGGDDKIGDNYLSISQADPICSTRQHTKSEFQRALLRKTNLVELFHYLTSKPVATDSDKTHRTRVSDQLISAIADSYAEWPLTADEDEANEEALEQSMTMTTTTTTPTSPSNTTTMADDEDSSSTFATGTACWRQTRLKQMGAEMRALIHRQQNPANCADARFLVCAIHRCGYGCQAHHVAFCLLLAAATNRTFLIENRDTHRHEIYETKRGRGAYFQPISKCSIDSLNDSRPFEKWRNGDPSSKVAFFDLTWINQQNAGVPQMVPAIPAQLADFLLTHTTNPPAFFVSQFLAYGMRKTDYLSKLLVDAEDRVGVSFDKEPIVGLHIRRTDKLRGEALLHTLDEYMGWAEYWFRVEEERRTRRYLQKQALKNEKMMLTSLLRLRRRVFIATDEVRLIEEAKKKYGSTYSIFGNASIVETAQLKTRFSEESLVGILSDIHLLAKCDYVVCTFSSNICRLVYELKLADGREERVHSIDSTYFFCGQRAQHLKATHAHKPTLNTAEIELRPGDRIEVGRQFNQWNGFLHGKNIRTGKEGTFPSYMVKDEWPVSDFPLFNDINV